MRLPLPLLLAAGCRVAAYEQGPVQYDALGLPDCAATWDKTGICTALKPWISSVPDDFTDASWGRQPVSWPGSEVEPYFCSDDPAEAESWLLEQDPLEDGELLFRDSTDPRWFDLIRDGAERQRVIRCDYLSWMAPAPPLTQPIAFATYAQLPADDPEDLSSFARQMMIARAEPLTTQVILAWGVVGTETVHFRTCGVRCGYCDDAVGGRFRHATGILESVEWTLDPGSGALDVAVVDLDEADCLTAW